MPEWSSSLQDELYGETVLFSTRERRAITRRGAAGGVALGALLAGLAVVFYLLRNVPGVSIDVPFFSITSDTPQGRAVLTALSGLALVAGLTFLALTYVFRGREGAHVVGTRTRLLRDGMFGVSTLRWRDFERADLDEEGTIHLVPFNTPRGWTWATQIVESPEAASVAATITALLAERARAREPVGPDARARTFTFRSTHTTSAHTGWSLTLVGIVAAMLGALVIAAIGSTLVTGGTVMVSTNGGPEREVGASDPAAWVPVALGAAFLAIGIALVILSRPRRRGVTFVASEHSLVVTPQGQESEEYAWRVFTGEIHRKRTRIGEELRLPLRRAVSARSRRQAVLRIVGLENADEVAAHLADRLRA